MEPYYKFQKSTSDHFLNLKMPITNQIYRLLFRYKCKKMLMQKDTQNVTISMVYLSFFISQRASKSSQIAKKITQSGHPVVKRLSTKCFLNKSGRALTGQLYR